MQIVGGIYRDRNGVEVEYVSVPLPTHEVTQAVPLAARMVGNRASRKERPFYEGTDGTELATQPRHHRLEAPHMLRRNQVAATLPFDPDPAAVPDHGLEGV